MEYLKENLFVNVAYSEWERQGNLPIFINERYRFKIAKIEGIETLFMYVKSKLEDIRVVKKHIEYINRSTDLPIILIMENILLRQRKSLIKDRQPFIVKDTQIYLPFLGVVLEEKFAENLVEIKTVLPSAQALLLYFIYSQKKEILMKDAVNNLGFSAMSISRALKQWEKLGILNSYKNGVSKIITSDVYGKKLYLRAEKYLKSPIVKTKRVTSLESIDYKGQMKLSSDSALANYSMLNPPRTKIYSVGRLNINKFEETIYEEGIVIEEWSYDLFDVDPTCVDILSLHQILKNNKDERVQIERGILLDNFWEGYSIDWNRKF